MIRSAVRTLSVLSLVTAVAGAVAVSHEHLAPDLVGDVVDGGGAASVPAVRIPPGRLPDAALQAAVLEPGTSALVGGSHAGADAGVALPGQAAAAPDAPALVRARGQAVALARGQAENRDWKAGKARRVAQELTHKRNAAALAAKRKERAERRARERAAAAARTVRAAARSASRDPQAVARLMLAGRGWSGQFSCLESLWQKESGWNHRASNPSSGAYGIPQALPGSKMASAGTDWRTNPVTQIRWGLDYIADRYGTPCAAWGHSQASNWY